MIFSPIDLVRELQREKARDEKAMAGLERTARAWLEEENKQDERVLQRLKGHKGGQDNADPRPEPDPARIYTEEQIRNICIRFRLRFLDSGYYQNPIPGEAIAEIRRLEKSKDNCTFPAFLVAAPASTFKLGDANADPLLFGQLDAQRYYLIHRWGKDLAWHRRLTSFPMRSLLHLLASLLLLSTVFCLSFPYEMLNIGNQSSFYIRGYLFFHSYIAFCGFTAFTCFSFHHYFSGMVWRSSHFNG